MSGKLAAAREAREMRFRAGVPGPRRPLGTASRLGVSRVSRNLASCAESRALRRGGGPLIASLSATCACEPHSEGCERSREKTKQCRWLMETRDPREGVDPSKRRVGAQPVPRLSLILSLSHGCHLSLPSFCLSFSLCFLRWVPTEIDLRSSLTE